MQGVREGGDSHALVQVLAGERDVGWNEDIMSVGEFGKRSSGGTNSTVLQRLTWDA